MGVEQIGIPPVDAQFLETRKMQRSEIAGMFRVPPHMIGDLDRSSFSNIEQQGIEFIQYALGIWLRVWEQAISRDLLTPKERTTYFAEHSLDWLMRGDTLARYQSYQSAINTGWMTPNEARERENMNPAEGGDELRQPLNMAAVGSTPGDANMPSDAQGARSWLHTDLPDCTCETCAARVAQPRALLPEQRGDSIAEHAQRVRGQKIKLMRSMQPLFEDCAKRVVKREVADIKRALDKQLKKRSALDFSTWLREFYSEFPQVVKDNFDALLASYGEQVTTLSADELGKSDPGLTQALRTFINEYLDTMANGHAASSRRQLEALLADAQADGADPADYITERLDAWNESRPSQMASNGAVEAGNALAVATYSALGVLYLRWVSSGESCPFCESLNGKIAGIAGHFVKAGSQLDGGAAGTMLVRRDTRHGPIHAACDCVTVAA